MFKQNTPLSPLSNYKIGGQAEYFFEAKNHYEVIKAVEDWQKLKQVKRPTDLVKSIFVLGGGTNVLMSEGVIPGLVLKPSIKTLKVNGNKITVGAGVLMSELLDFAVKHGLAGLEWAGGLPGTVGGAIRGNAGCFGGETKDVVGEVKSIDLLARPLKVKKRGNKECRFGYRDSVFKQNGSEVILEATFAMKPGDKKELRRLADSRIAYRKERHPIEYPNIGSIFKNVDLNKVPKSVRARVAHVVKSDPFPVVPTAYLISDTGIKGVSSGGAMISPKHPNFIVNVLNATSGDVKSLIILAKLEVKKKFGVELEEEVLVL